MVGDAPPSAATGAKRFAWSIYDFANSGYTTVVLTTVFNAYFVAVVAGGRCMSAIGRKRTFDFVDFGVPERPLWRKADILEYPQDFHKIDQLGTAALRW